MLYDIAYISIYMYVYSTYCCTKAVVFKGIYITVYNTEAKKIERLTSLTFTRVFLSPVIEQWHIN